MPAAPVAAPVVKKSKATPVLAVLMVVFLLAAGALAALFVMTKQDTDKKINDQQAQITSLTNDLTEKTSAADKATQDLTTAKKDLDAAKTELTAVNKTVNKDAPCLNAAKDLAKAAKAGDNAASSAAATSLVLSCD